MKKKLLVDFLKWYSESIFLESEISGRFVDYKKPDIFYTAEQIIEIFLNSEPDAQECDASKVDSSIKDG